MTLLEFSNMSMLQMDLFMTFYMVHAINLRVSLSIALLDAWSPFILFFQFSWKRNSCFAGQDEVLAHAIWWRAIWGCTFSLVYLINGSKGWLKISRHLSNAGRKGVKGAQPGPVLSWAQKVKIAVGAARGLEYLHEKAYPRIIHRDIKSSNVLTFDALIWLHGFVPPVLLEPLVIILPSKLIKKFLIRQADFHYSAFSSCLTLIYWH